MPKPTQPKPSAAFRRVMLAVRSKARNPVLCRKVIQEALSDGVQLATEGALVPFESTPWHAAVERDNLAALEVMWPHIQPHLTPDQQYRLLEKSVNTHNVGLSQWLMERGVPLHSTKRHGNLFHAMTSSVQHPHAMAQWLLKHGISPTPSTDIVLPPLILALVSLRQNAHDTLEALLDAGADIHATHQSSPLTTPLHQAALHGGQLGLDIWRLLLERGGRPDVEDGNGDSPIAILKRTMTPTSTAFSNDDYFEKLRAAYSLCRAWLTERGLKASLPETEQARRLRF